MNRRRRRERLLLAVVVLLSLTLLTLDSRDAGSPLSAVREGAAAVFGPVQRGADTAVRAVQAPVNGLRRLGRDRDEVERLQRENDALRQRLQQTQDVRRRLDEVDALMRTAGAGRYRVVPARVVALGSALGFERTATIDVGSRDGVQPDMTVLNGDGLVGRTKTVGPTTSVVVLAVDGLFSAGTRQEGSGQIGVVSGRGRGPMTLELPDPRAVVRQGDRLVTLGSVASRPFVAGVPVGEVSAVVGGAGVLARTAEVRPFVDFGGLDLVGVVVEPPRSDPRDSVLPPPPPAAAPTTARP